METVRLYVEPGFAQSGLDPTRFGSVRFYLGDFVSLTSWSGMLG